MLDELKSNNLRTEKTQIDSRYLNNNLINKKNALVDIISCD